MLPLDPGSVVVKRMRALRDKRGLNRMAIWCLLRFGADMEVDLNLAQVDQVLNELVADEFLVRTTERGGATIFKLAKWMGPR